MDEECQYKEIKVKCSICMLKFSVRESLIHTILTGHNDWVLPKGEQSER
jgi:hypothetical protein